MFVEVSLRRNLDRRRGKSSNPKETSYYGCKVCSKPKHTSYKKEKDRAKIDKASFIFRRMHVSFSTSKLPSANGAIETFFT